MSRDILRNIPKVDEVLKHTEGGPKAIRAVRIVLEQLREGILRGDVANVPDMSEIAARVHLALRRTGRVLGGLLMPLVSFCTQTLAGRLLRSMLRNL